MQLRHDESILLDVISRLHYSCSYEAIVNRSGIVELDEPILWLTVLLKHIIEALEQWLVVGMAFLGGIGR